MGATVVVVAFAVVGEAVVIVGAACDQCKASEYGSGVGREPRIRNQHCAENHTVA